MSAKETQARSHQEIGEDMDTFDFTKVQAKKSAAVPALSRPKADKPNPLAKEYEKSLATTDANGFGLWQYLDLPGTVEITKNGDGKEVTTYGPVVKKAVALLRQAAVKRGKGVSFRYETPDDKNKMEAGNVRLHFQAKPKRGTIG